jgi:predicted nucleic-acid-binding protein
MLAADTNVLVRLLAVDDARQHAEARALFTVSKIWIAKTVLLETVWVLRKEYGFDHGVVSDVIGKLLGLANVQVEDEESVLAALSLMGSGIDFADAIHLSSKPPGCTFVSFDKALVKRAKQAGVAGVSGIPVRE